jgi:hypothetical protein
VQFDAVRPRWRRVLGVEVGSEAEATGLRSERGPREQGSRVSTGNASANILDGPRPTACRVTPPPPRIEGFA